MNFADKQNITQTKLIIWAEAQIITMPNKMNWVFLHNGLFASFEQTPSTAYEKVHQIPSKKNLKKKARQS